MSDEKRKPKNENRKRKPNPSSDPIRSDGSRSPVPRSSARALGVCTYINSFKSGYPISVCSNASGRVDRKGSGRVDRSKRIGSIDRSIDRSKRVLESIDRSIEKGRSGRVGSGRVEVGPGGTAPGTTRATRRRRRRTAARNSRTELAHAREEKFLATELGDFSRLLASTRSHARGLALVDSLGWYRARLRGTRDVGDDDVRDDDAARGGGAGGVEKTDGNNV